MQLIYILSHPNPCELYTIRVPFTDKETEVNIAQIMYPSD